jgi:2-methylisocitrate lyase-like PEP mutase family enzyme
MASSQSDKATRFRALHQGPAFVIPNPWDAGSARILTSLGFQALATSSGASAGILGRRDGKVLREEALAHARAIVDATDLPVSADLEKGFGDEPASAAETIRLAAGVGLVGGSIEDATGDKDKPLYDIAQATERVTAAVQAARALSFPFTLTARAEGFLRGKPDLDDVIKRLQAFEKAGADVLMSPGLPDLESVRKGVRRPLQAVQLHGGHQGQVLHGGRARGRGGEADQPRHLALSHGHDRPRRGRARGEGQGHLRLHRPLAGHAGHERLHAGLSAWPVARSWWP